MRRREFLKRCNVFTADLVLGAPALSRAHQPAHPLEGSAKGGLKLTEPYTLRVSFELRDVSLAPPSNWKCREK